eukprot:NODE_3447_length_785_cov_285.634247.p4 GENE.NODE_3447_length_785_cov_285.634247~~NODE_3447_length_785_cov_285.634247.p4  ORF type:complete len:60 (+),score=34.01 NODE_3447_length_785_cov_285.634247:546-725(+)
MSHQAGTGRCRSRVPTTASQQANPMPPRPPRLVGELKSERHCHEERCAEKKKKKKKKKK